MQSIVRRLTAVFFLSGQWRKVDFCPIKSGQKVDFLSTKVDFLVDFCGLFRPQRKTRLTFAASDPKNKQPKNPIT